jgi:hypothetical protein
MRHLADIKDGDWRGFRQVARRYQSELRRIRDATAVPADALRKFATEALTRKRRKRRV